MPSPAIDFHDKLNRVHASYRRSQERSRKQPSPLLEQRVKEMERKVAERQRASYLTKATLEYDVAARRPHSPAPRADTGTRREESQLPRPRPLQRQRETAEW